MKNISKKFIKFGSKFLAVLFSTQLILGCTSQTAANQLKAPNGEQIFLEYALTADERREGLMYRQELNRNSGMLFVFEEAREQSFWMKNTLIALDMVFIDADKVVVDLASMSPCPQETLSCPAYRSKGKAKYVLEINGGLAQEFGFEIGQKLDFNVLDDQIK